MATIPIKSLFGKLLGLTHASSTYPIERLVVPGGIITQAIYMSTAAGSETAVNIQGFSDIETSSTGTAALATRGQTIIASGQSSLYTLAAPPAAGVRKVICTTSTSTAVRQITSAVSIVGGASVGGDSGTLTASTSFTVLTFNGLGQTQELLALSTAAWQSLVIRGYSTGATPLSS